MPEIFSQPIFKFLIAALLGAFLGLRREIDAQKFSREKNFAGLRSTILLAAIGAISTFFSIKFLPIIFFAAILILIAISHAHGSFVEKKIGITTELSALLIFWIGVLVGENQQILAILLTIFLAVLNAFKKNLHKFAKNLTPIEWTGALQFLILSGAVLPFLPQNPVDPFGILVPFKIWLLVILISGIGFLGYFLIKYFGARGGIPLLAFLGSTVSSTAVSMSLAAQSRKFFSPEIFAMGIFIALGTMQMRVVGEIFLLGGAQFFDQFLLVPFSMSVSSFLVAFYFFKKKVRTKIKPEIKIEQPFEILPALKFGAIFVLVLFAIAIGQKFFGDSGVYAASFFSGFIDVDAIVLSSIESVRLGEIPLPVAQNSIAISLFINTLVKIFFVATLGSKKLMQKIFGGVFFTTAVGGIFFLLF